MGHPDDEAPAKNALGPRLLPQGRSSMACRIGGSPVTDRAL